MGTGAVTLPPLPPGATLAPAGGAAPGSSGLPPLPPGAKMLAGSTASPAGTQPASGPAQGTAAPAPGGTILPGSTGGEGDPVGQLAAGFSKSAGYLLGNVLDMITRPAPQFDFPGYPAGKATQQPAPIIDVGKHVHDAANWLRSGGQPQGFWENVGAIGEQVLEYIGTDGLLKIVGPAAGAAETSEHLKQAQQVAQVVKGNPKLAGLLAVGLKASKDALLMGGQTYLHTGDPAQALEAAGAGGVTRGLTEGVGAAGRALLKRAPKTLEVAGEKIPALASQVNDAGEPTGTTAAGAPKIAAGQQAGAQAVIKNTAQQGTQSALDRINSTRPVYAPVTDSTRLLEAGAPSSGQPFAYAYNAAGKSAGKMSAGAPSLETGGAQQSFTFRLEGTPTTEAPTGKVAQSAQQEPQAAFKPPRFQTASAPTRTADFAPNGRIVAGEEGATGADIRTAETPQPKEDAARGGGVLETTSPHEAEAWLQQLEDVKQSPAYDDLPARQQGQIDRQYQALRDQLGMYHASPYAQRFAPVDVAAAAGQVRTFGDAAAQIQSAVKPVYQQLDALSGGEFAKWNGAVKQAQRVIRSATSVEAVDAAELRLSEANEAIDGLITRHAGDISQEDYRAARMGWRDSMVLSNLHNVTERMMNGVTAEESEQGLPRIMTGNTKLLQSWLAKGNNLTEVQRLIGPEGVTNLKRITLLLSSQNTARAAASVAKETWLAGTKAFGPHLSRMSAGGVTGAAVAALSGGDVWHGAMTGAALAEGMRAVLRQAAINPDVGNLLEYAARNHLSPQHYAPLLARTVWTPAEEEKPAGADKPAAEGTAP